MSETENFYHRSICYCTSLATSAGLHDLWLDLLVCGLEAGKLRLGLRVLIPELNVGSKFYVL